MTRGDRMLVAVLVVLALSFTPAALAIADGSQGTAVTIEGPSGTTTVSLDEPTSLVVEGLVSDVVVVVSEGGVRVAESGCEDQMCVRCGTAKASGSAIACVPNGVSVTVGGDDREAPDVIVR